LTYFDTSALVSLHVADGNSRALDAYLTRTPTVVAISRFGAAEFASAVSVRVRTMLLPLDDAATLIREFDSWRPGVAGVLDATPDDIIVSETYVRRFELELKAPDALHIAMCARAGLPLLTFDRNQARAAALLGLQVITPR